MKESITALLLILGMIFVAPAQEKSKSGEGLVIYKVEMDADEVVQVLKANLEAQQITLVDTTNPAAPLSNNVKIFPDFDKLNVSFIQNFLVTSITTLYKIYTVDPNAMVLSPWVITIYQYEDDDYSYIVRTKTSQLLKGSTHPEVIKAVKELESRIDAAIADLL
ncbi:hypothetical protein [Persephonella sp.]|uniref:hypothetical protein n=1 Tax=Persephonella sp. TaxID=2060922 RepID=UPI0025E1726B|nr:hypothetical protein [Persephonella sp.]